MIFAHGTVCLRSISRTTLHTHTHAHTPHTHTKHNGCGELFSCCICKLRSRTFCFVSCFPHHHLSKWAFPVWKARQKARIEKRKTTVKLPTERSLFADPATPRTSLEWSILLSRGCINWCMHILYYICYIYIDIYVEQQCGQFLHTL